MTIWRDGMGRVTYKRPTGTTPRGEVVWEGARLLGVCRAPGWLQVAGPATIRVQGVPSGAWRAWVAERARYRRQQRHGPRSLRNRGFGPGAGWGAPEGDPRV